MKKFFINIPRYLPLGIVAWVLSGIFFGNMEPSLELNSLGFSPFFIGCAICIVVLLLSEFAAGSIGSAIRLLSLKSPTVAGRIIWALILISSCAAWGGTADFMFSIYQNVTARSGAEINGKFLYYAKWGSRDRCQKMAVFSTEYGEIGACAMGHSSNFNMGTFIPNSLNTGDEVVLVGRENNSVFVLKKIKFSGK
jgi:hypothetical protein